VSLRVPRSCARRALVRRQRCARDWASKAIDGEAMILRRNGRIDRWCSETVAATRGAMR
jgi:hypothetical protein